MKFTSLKIAAWTVFGFVFFALGGCLAEAQTMQFSQPTYLTIPTNSPTLSTGLVSVSIPAISLTVTATNLNTIVTNTLVQVVTVTNVSTFVYNAGAMGTNFSTNFPASTYTATVRLYGNATPQAGGSNTCYIQ